jgi:hypothetical protein
MAAEGTCGHLAGSDAWLCCCSAQQETRGSFAGRDASGGNLRLPPEDGQFLPGAITPIGPGDRTRIEAAQSISPGWPAVPGVLTWRSHNVVRRCPASCAAEPVEVADPETAAMQLAETRPRLDRSSEANPQLARLLWPQEPKP